MAKFQLQIKTESGMQDVIIESESLDLSTVVKLSGSQTIEGVKNFILRPQYNGINLPIASDIPTNNSQLTNGAGYQTASDVSLAIASSGGFGYDVTITTQSEFETLMASSTWLGAKSVLFMGNGGTLEFTISSGAGVLIPSTVTQISGVNSAIIKVSGFDSSVAYANRFGVYYSEAPSDFDYSISNLYVKLNTYGTAFANCYNMNNCKVESSSTYQTTAFKNCTKLSNCEGDGYGQDYSTGIVFHQCNQLTNCKATAYPGWDASIGFYYCNDILNCKADTYSSYTDSSGFWYCNRLTNCEATSYNNESDGGSGKAFYECSCVSNCKGVGEGNDQYNLGVGFYNCKQISNCVGENTTAGYGFYGCSYVSNCTGSGEYGLTGGTMTYVDSETVG